MFCSFAQAYPPERPDQDGYNTYDLFAQSCSGSGSSGTSWQTLSPGLNTTVEHVTGATEPMGYSELVQYDYQDRTTAVYNNLGQATTTQWDPVQDIQYSTTNPEGLMSTKVYNDENQLVSQYGPAPASDFNTWNTTLAPGQSMSEGQSIWSEDHRFQFIFETNGNVTLYGPNGWIWQAGTAGDAATTLTMETNGNLVEYNGSTPIWYSNTYTNGPSTYLTVQNDGNAVLYNAYGPVWSTGTGGQGPAAGGESSSGYDTPLSAYASQVCAATDTVLLYDSGVTGLSVNYFAVSEPSANDASLSGAPLYQSTNISNDGGMDMNWGSTPPIPNYSGDWGFSATGAMRLPSTGQWTFTMAFDGGVRMWIDNKLVINYWLDNPGRLIPVETGQYNNTVADTVHSVRIDYYATTATSDPQFALSATPPGGSGTSQVAQYLSPDYGLQASAKSYDNTVGNTSVTTAYGTDPGLGQVASTTVDPTGLNLTSSDTYQTPGSGYGMLTSTTAPGGAATSYSYYGATDTAANPCVGGTAAYRRGCSRRLRSRAARRSRTSMTMQVILLLHGQTVMAGSAAPTTPRSGLPRTSSRRSMAARVAPSPTTTMSAATHSSAARPTARARSLPQSTYSAAPLATKTSTVTPLQRPTTTWAASVAIAEHSAPKHIHTTTTAN